jgi:flavin reductase (DIM6/NTAB) family NADH-FMN oxidoreductase RutF
VGAEAFSTLAARMDYPMFIVTTRSPEGVPAGCLVGFATQVSIAPPRFMAAISRVNHTFPAAMAAASIAVHLPGDDQTGLARLFGGETGDDIDKFARCRWHDGPGGAPVLDDCPAWIAGPVRERVNLGDHVGVVIDIAHAHDAGLRRQLQASQIRDMEPGHPA